MVVFILIVVNGCVGVITLEHKVEHVISLMEANHWRGREDSITISMNRFLETKAGPESTTFTGRFT